MSHSKHQREIAADLARLRRMLEKTVRPSVAVPAATGAPPASSEVAILNLACGACHEAETVSEFFSQLKSGPEGKPAPTLLVGADVRDRELDGARARFRGSGKRAFEFITGDAAKLAGHRELREKFDVVMFRHQNLYHGRTLWRRLFEQGIAKLDDSGLLVITSYFDREHELALKTFEELGVELVTTVRNPSSRALATPGKSVDRHVAVLRKK